jgi:hypothetical protein
VSALVVDPSIWIDFFRGGKLPALEEALRAGDVVLREARGQVIRTSVPAVGGFPGLDQRQG